MDEDLSSFAQGNTDFDVGPVSHDVDAEDAADALKREKQLNESLENAFNDISDDEVNETSEDDSDDSDSSSGASDEESDHSHQNKSEVDVEQLPIKQSYDYSEQPNQHSVLIGHEFPTFEQHCALTDSEVIISKTSDVNCSRISDVNCSNNSDENYSHASYENHSRNLDVNHSKNAPVNDSNFSHSYASDVDQSNVYSFHRTEHPVNHDNISEHKSDVISKSCAINSLPKGDSNESEIYDQHDYGGVSRITHPSQFNNQTELYEEYKKLLLVNRAICEESQQVNREAIRARENFEKEIQSLKSRLKHIEADKEKFFSSLQDAQNTISDITHDNNVLKGKLTALEIQFSAEKKARETAQASLESADITIQSLEQQLKGLTQSDNARRLQQQNESIIKDLKLRHQKEVQKYKEDIDKLQENFNAKVIESDNLSSKLSQLQKKSNERMEEKDEAFNKLSIKLEAAEKERNELLETGNNTSEVFKLRFQLELLQEEKLKLEKQNSDLKDEVRSLERQSETCETIKTLTLGKELLSEKSNKGQNSHSESNLKAELQKSHQNNHSLQVQNHSMKEKLEDLMHKLSVEEERVKLFESLHKESEEKLKELEKKLQEVLPYGSIPVSQHEKKVKSLESELAECNKKLRDLAERFKSLSSSESVLQEENESLKNYITEMLKKHKEEKIEIAEEFRKRFLETHENAVLKLEKEFTSKSESDIKVISYNYENRIAELEKELQYLHDELYSARSDFVKISDENKSLQLQIDSMSQIKERKEIEREIQLAYEKKLNKMKEQLQKEKTQFESNLKSEIEKAQVEWTKQKMAQVEKFVNQTKDQLDAKFVKCLNEEKEKLEAEKIKILDECQEKLNSLQEKYEAEKSDLHTNFQRNWESEMKKLHQGHQAEIESITEKFEKKIASLENEIKVLQEKSNYNFELKAEEELLHTELKQRYEEEKKKLTESFQKKRKNEIKELQQNYQKKVESVKKSYQDKIVTLEDEIKILKENLLKASNPGELQILKEDYANAKLALEKEKIDLLNSEHLLKDKLSTAVELEKKLLEKNKKLKKYIVNLEKTHKVKCDVLQKQNEELKKSIIDKENELQLVKTEYDSCKHSLEEKRQRHQRIRNFACQTEHEVISSKDFQDIYDMFLQCLKTISAKVNAFLAESRKRSAEQLKKALSFYHDHLISKIYQDLWKDARSISPNFGVPRVNRHLKSSASSSDNLISPDVMQHPLNSNFKISNSTPADVVISDNTHKNLESQMNNISNVRACQNIKSPPDSANGFTDISFDFMPIKMSDLEQTSVKLPQYSMPRGLFHGENIFNSHTQS